MKKIYSFIIGVVCLFLTKPSSAQTQVTYYTSMGNFVVELYDDLAPITTNNFLDLVNSKFYDGIIFHRVIDGFMIQGGDPLGTGYGGPGYTIPDEFGLGLSNVQKAVSMANAGPNTGGSQFFINLVDNLYLDGGYPVFGIVITDFSVVQNIGVVATNAEDKPLVDVVMDSLRVTFDPFVAIQTINNSSLLVELNENPITANSVMTIQSENAPFANIQVIDIIGNIVFKKALQLNSGLNYFTCRQLQNIGEGMYFIVISDGKTTSIKNIIISK